MQWHLDEIASQVTPGAHAVLMFDQAGLSVIYVPRVPFWKMCDFNVLDLVYCGNPLILREI
jgi:hypothetical protein